MTQLVCELNHELDWIVAILPRISRLRQQILYNCVLILNNKTDLYPLSLLMRQLKNFQLFFYIFHFFVGYEPLEFVHFELLRYFVNCLSRREESLNRVIVIALVRYRHKY